MIIPVASDHAGFEAKRQVIEILEQMGHLPVDFGTHSPESVDYPDFAVLVAKKVNDEENPNGILICGSGQGMCIAANKYPNVRAALVYSEKSARLSRQHNDANILCLPGKELDRQQLQEIVKVWLDTDFEGGRHQRRVEKIRFINDK
ncbi:MAG: ribose 5-phosphate isomerase B [Balneolaceae bacterium]|nr:MAG: ribose 5-phosphate isomerase B [Balneolaceae bacterium]